jgi:hypothetical protein
MFLFGCNKNEKPYVFENDFKKDILFEFSSGVSYEKIAFIGNSITQHEPWPAIGWHCSCGMAASLPEHDFDYLVTDFFQAKQLIFNLSKWERDFDNSRFFGLIDLYIFNPDAIVINLGENFKSSEGKEAIVNHLENLHFDITSNSNAKVFYVDDFYNVDKVNNAFLEFKYRHNINLVRVSDMVDGKYRALGHENFGVSTHPNDRGHKLIAKKIIKSMLAIN